MFAAMKNRAQRVVSGAFALAWLLPASVAFAQQSGGASPWDGLLYGVTSTAIYGGLGIVLTIIGYRLFAMMLPFDVKHELEEDHNMSVGVLLAALVLGICIIVAATIHS